MKIFIVYFFFIYKSISWGISRNKYVLCTRSAYRATPILLHFQRIIYIVVSLKRKSKHPHLRVTFFCGFRTCSSPRSPFVALINAVKSAQRELYMQRVKVAAGLMMLVQVLRRRTVVGTHWWMHNNKPKGSSSSSWLRPASANDFCPFLTGKFWFCRSEFAIGNRRLWRTCEIITFRRHTETTLLKTITLCKRSKPFCFDFRIIGRIKLLSHIGIYVQCDCDIFALHSVRVSNQSGNFETFI